jgi:protein-tyrosine phosphatase
MEIDKKIKQHNTLAIKDLNLYDLKGTKSRICCHGKPKTKEIKHFNSIYGVNHFLILLHAKEEPEKIIEACKKQNIGYYHIDIGAATIEYLEEQETIDLIVTSLLEIYKLLKENEISLYVHCAAGYHRTGTFVYCILRMFEETDKSAMEALRYIRLDTYKNVGDERIQYSEEKLLPTVFLKLKSMN